MQPLRNHCAYAATMRRYTATNLKSFRLNPKRCNSRSIVTCRTFNKGASTVCSHLFAIVRRRLQSELGRLVGIYWLKHHRWTTLNQHLKHPAQLAQLVHCNGMLSNVEQYSELCLE